jgi:hypothetical protein
MKGMCMGPICRQKIGFAILPLRLIYLLLLLLFWPIGSSQAFCFFTETSSAPSSLWVFTFPFSMNDFYNRSIDYFYYCY